MVEGGGGDSRSGIDEDIGHVAERAMGGGGGGGGGDG